MNFFIRFLFYNFLLFTCSSLLAQQPTVGLLKNTEEVYPGYTLFSGSTNTYLIDNCGELIHKWESDYRPAAAFYLLENGDLIRPVRTTEQTNFGGGGIGGGIEQLDWEGNVVWFFDYAENNSHHQHHDIEPLPNGNVLVLAWEYKSAEEAVAAGRIPGTINNALWPTQIIEIKPIFPEGGKIVWEWHLWDHLIQDADSSKVNYETISQNPGKLDINFRENLSVRADWIHANALLYVEKYDWIVFSSKHTHEIYVIDHSTSSTEAATSNGGNYNKGGNFLYRWGNQKAYQRGYTSDKKLFDQHDVTFIEATTTEPAQFLIFNNGTSRGNDGKPYSTVVSIDIPIDNMGDFLLQDGEAYPPANYYFEYENAEDKTSFFSPNVSSAQRLPNGNTLIAEGNTGYFFEINPLKELVWIYQNPVTAAFIFEQGADLSDTQTTANSPRVRRYALNYPAFKGKDLSPKGKIELNPYEDNCTLITSTYEDEVLAGEMIVYYNPISKTLSVPFDKVLSIKLFNTNGQLLKASYQKNEMQLNSLANGIYLLLINRGGYHLIKKIMVN